MPRPFVREGKRTDYQIDHEEIGADFVDEQSIRRWAMDMTYLLASNVLIKLQGSPLVRSGCGIGWSNGKPSMSSVAQSFKTGVVHMDLCLQEPRTVVA
ncbi:hypothetical protein EYR41_000557 [Orbilia oligospora]|uniref:Uncharacterized protein n=1 Tax=Orbilia oligospora TaxID=2813651 RepID=A0A8H2E6P9_ORBOL|nr:hypothetical protein EYR41_000557 [Orbilia oligospora]